MGVLAVLVGLLASGCALGPSLPGESKVDRAGQFGAPGPAQKSLSHQFNDSALGGFAMAGKAKTPTAALEDAAAILEKGKTKAAIRHFTRVAVKWPESPQARVALRTMAELQEGKNPEKAFITYQILIDRYAGKFDFEEVLEKQMDIAGGIQSEKSAGARLISGLHNPAKAIPYYQQIISNAPAWDRAAEAQYIIGEIYQSDKDFYDATEAYRRVLEEYGDSEFVERAMFYQAECYYKIATGRATERQVENAYVYLGRFLDNYDDSEFTPSAFDYKSEIYDKLAEAAFEVAVYYDTRTKRQDSALVSYREFVNRFPAAKQVAIANQRIAELSSDNPPPFKYAKSLKKKRDGFRLPWQKKKAPEAPAIVTPSDPPSVLTAAAGGAGTDLAARSDVPNPVGASDLMLEDDSEPPSYGPLMPGQELSSAPSSSSVSSSIPSAPTPPQAVSEAVAPVLPEVGPTATAAVTEARDLVVERPDLPRSTTITIPVRQTGLRSGGSTPSVPTPVVPAVDALPPPAVDVSVPAFDSAPSFDPAPAIDATPAIDTAPAIDATPAIDVTPAVPLRSSSGLLDIRP